MCAVPGWQHVRLCTREFFSYYEKIHMKGVSSDFTLPTCCCQWEIITENSISGQKPAQWMEHIPHRQWPKSMNYMYIQCSTKWFILGQNHPGFSWHIVKCLLCVFPMLLQCKYQENIVKCARKVPARKWQCYIFQRFCSLKVNKNTNINCEIKRYGIKIYL